VAAGGFAGGRARISASTIHSNEVDSGFWGSDVVSRFFAGVSERLADFGRVIWNPLATNLVTRALLGLLAASAIYDALKTVLRRVFSDQKTGDLKTGDLKTGEQKAAEE
jgi:hypothetical protein